VPWNIFLDKNETVKTQRLHETNAGANAGLDAVFAIPFQID
jgi:hypothetical protein